MKTRADLINAIGENLGVKAAGQSLSAEDEALIDARLDGALGELAARRVFPYVDTQEFEDESYLAIADGCTPFCSIPFGVSQVAGMDINSFRQQAEQRLRRIAETTFTHSPLVAEYF
jgi:hypothetical protein